ncbi:DEAD/DEAH box helicase [Bacteroides stercorirosoris]|uniref:DEAD-box ATP-dependent RNA helicase RhpA n=1 Tax=Bacteroides stercorirosoris TaxID=871324 RepID=A0A1M6D7D3_9BACE|nr:DEAD/DEAH box helicase [Bacteroides stercorirosoris]SHI69110.1 ATP-dependent RNA helicase DeaD [Bacteroides stercorirosoris]
MKNFEELGLSPEIRRAIEEMGYECPMPVQEEVIPYLLGENNDVVALAQTGTGKTAAFGLPLIQKINVKNRIPQSLILCPTRELCLQIAGDLNDYSKYITGLRVLPVYGGSSIDSQIRALKQGVHIIVATPGRLLDLMERKTVSLTTIQNVVMDEADEMLNMGFTDSINAILADVPQERNTLLFSATMSPEIARISKKYLRDAKEITIGRKNESTSNVKHVVFTVHAKDKYAALKRIVDYYPQIYGIIFCRTRKETQEIADKLMQEGYNADALHGELSQAQRDTVMQKFRIRNLQILVATDVAARGLDVDDLTHVINYGLPDDTESYTHRSGRTGRAGKTGTSIAIINLREKGKMREIERIISKKFIIGEMPTGKQICEKQLLKVIDDLKKVKVNEEDMADFMPDIYRKLDWLSKEDLIKRMVSHEFNRFSEYYRNRGDIEIPTDSRGERSSRGNTDRNGDRSRKAEPGYTRLFINLGKMDNFFPNELISLLNNNTRGRVELGRIDLMPKFSFFEVDEKEAANVVKSLNRANWNGRKVSVEIAGEEGKEAPKGKRKSEGGYAKEGGYGKKRSFKDEKRSDAPRKGRSKSENAPADKKGAPADKKKSKPSREERGYTGARGKKDDWRQFFQNDNKEFRDKEPDFSEEGWARRTPKKK